MTQTPKVRPISEGRLRGRAIFLSASVPVLERSEIFRRIPDTQREIEQAVIALARGVFAEGGELVFGGHPSISPLIAMVAGEYRPAPTIDSPRDDAAPPVIVHQLDAYRSEIGITGLMESLGQARIIWHETLKEELKATRHPGAPPYPKSLERMRRRMLESPGGEGSLVAMVCMGGMEGILEEAELFAGLRKPLFVIESTGGAAALLARRNVKLPVNLRMPQIAVTAIDEELLSKVDPRLRDQRGELVEVPPRFTPYPAIVSEIIRRLS